jgi:hypothetical protein
MGANRMPAMHSAKFRFRRYSVGPMRDPQGPLRGSGTALPCELTKVEIRSDRERKEIVGGRRIGSSKADDMRVARS